MLFRKMGNYWSNDFYIYARKKDSDSYELLHTISEGNPMSRFKHEVYAYALTKRYKEMKSMYLYWGSNRVAKAIMIRNDLLYLQLEFASEQTASDWDQCQEQIQKVYVDISWLEKQFTDNWCPLDSEESTKRKYENYKLTINA